jgi:hypothetical protein
MPSSLVLGIWFLLFLFNNDFDEDDDSGNDTSNLVRMMT